MSMKDAVEDVMAAIVVLRRAKDACAHLTPPGAMRRHEDLLTRARLIHAVVETRHKLQSLHQRSLRLEAAVERFKAQRLALRG